MNKIKISSINIHGLRNRRKRAAFFRYAKTASFDIVCVQESYITQEVKDSWEKEWGGSIFYSYGTPNSLGQMILIKKKIACDTELVKCTNRIITIKIKLDDDDLFISNVYAPTIQKEKEPFLRELTEHMHSLESPCQLVCGDFNCVVDNKQDIVSGNKHYVKDVESFNAFIAESELNDVWRMFNTNKKEYTWSRNNPFTARRLDYIFATDSVFDGIENCCIESIAQSDHRTVYTTFTTSRIDRGPSYWKFNENLLHDKTFIEQMNAFLEEYQGEDNLLEDQLKWDMCKVKIKELCIQYSKYKNNKQKSTLHELHEKLNKLEGDIASNPKDRHLMQQKDAVKTELEIYEQNIAKGAQIRSKVKFIEDGEKNTKYFLNLEKTKSRAKILDYITKENGQTIRDQNGIIQEIVNFYRHRYKKKVNFQAEDAEEFLKDINIPQLSEEQKAELEEEITENEILSALKKMKNGSSPGSDGLTTGFYKFFWNKIKDMVRKSFDTAFRNGEMSPSQKRAIITLIHKGKQLTRDNLNNWRPISLANTDYKLLAKLLAIRLSSVISNLISEDQVGFMKGRNIAHIIRTIEDVLSYLDHKQKPGILFALDYKAAFDTISKEFILWSFERFNFGNTYVNWVKTLMKNTNSCVSYMGWLTETFEIQAGIRQGCPFSPMAFILAVEILAIRLRADETIKGIKLPRINNQTEFNLKLQSYADDITIMIEDKQDLKNALTLITYFTKFSGLAMNKQKSEAMWLGSNKHSNEKPYDLKWQNRIKILGVYFSNNINASEIDENWIPRIDKISKAIAAWSKRNLSIIGKICVVKSLLLSQFTYVLQALCAPTDFLKKINTLFFRFIWKKKYSNTRAFEKVKRKVICNTTENGGLNMIDIIDMQNSFLLSWAAKLQNQPNQKWTCIPYEALSKTGLSLCCFKANVKANSFKGINQIPNPFWKQVLICWLNSNSLQKTHLCTNPTEQCLWNNIHVVYRGQTLFLKDWMRSGITMVSDVMENNNVKSFEAICNITGDKPSRMFEYRAVRAAVQTYLRKIPQNDTNEIEQDYISLHSLTTPHQFRSYLLRVNTVQPTAAKFWENKLNFKMQEKTWLIANECTKESRLRLLHWKISHNIYPTNILLSKMGITNTNKCSFCPNEVDFVEHFFYNCKKIRSIWKYVEQKILFTYQKQLKLSCQEVLLGFNRENETDKRIISFINLLILIAKMCIGIVKYYCPMDIEDLLDRELHIRKVINR